VCERVMLCDAAEPGELGDARGVVEAARSGVQEPRQEGRSRRQSPADAASLLQRAVATVRPIYILTCYS